MSTTNAFASAHGIRALSRTCHTKDRYEDDETSCIPSARSVERETRRLRRPVGPRVLRCAASLAAASFSIMAGPSALAADLEVTHIERNPKYEKYLVLYTGRHEYTDDFTPYEVDSAIGLANPGAKRWPDVGEMVTFTAHVRNRGDTNVTSFGYTWLLDGATWGSGTFEGSLPPGGTAELSRVWSWGSGRHTVGFRVALEGEETPTNNELVDVTDALSFYSVIEESYDAAFRANTASVPHPRTAYVTEWLQNHIKRYNQMFAEAGAPTRVRYDELSVVPDGSHPNGCGSSCKYYDGSFPQVFKAADPDWRLGASAFYEAAEDIDYGLLHELAHQLGLIDQYRLDLTAEQNRVNDLSYSAPPGLTAHVEHFVNAHTAGGLHSWHNLRRGYFGQYLFDIPQTNRLELQDVCRHALDGANVRVFQKIERMSQGEELPDIAKFSGTSDAEGIYVLPNVVVDTTNFPPTATGNRLRDNPFGYISNHGDNGLFLIEALKDGQTAYAFLDILQFNLRYWAGEDTIATYPVVTGYVPGADPDDAAIGQPASADIPSYVSGWCGTTVPSVPSNANDGDMESVWCRDRVLPGHYWEVDLGAELHPYKVVAYTDYRAYRCESSPTGAFSGEQSLVFRRDGPIVGSRARQEFAFYPKPARYVRMTIEQAQDWVRHREVQVFVASGPCWSGPMAVPDDAVRVDKSGDDLTVDWAETCGVSSGYTIYEGDLDALVATATYTHASVVCDDFGERLTETFTPSDGNRYYLVVPRQTDGREGDYGHGRPQGIDAASCGITSQSPGECP